MYNEETGLLDPVMINRNMRCIEMLKANGSGIINPRLIET
ncbi:hypothetical protein IMSAGC011_02863 [Lachnospiraceae bacterium]|nr:hypothetical protein IMSAGC011_02863 [Lachnospiraceae bacterium]